jgi:hypothetical protein
MLETQDNPTIRDLCDSGLSNWKGSTNLQQLEQTTLKFFLVRSSFLLTGICPLFPYHRSPTICSTLITGASPAKGTPEY